MTESQKKAALKELADAMEAGWHITPHMVRNRFFDGNPYDPAACCARGHAGLGKFSCAWNGTVSYFPILEEQMVQQPGGHGVYYLRGAIDDLVWDYKWNTPDVVRWIRTHI